MAYEIETTPSAGITVLVVDDEHLIADSIAEILNRNGFQARAVYDARAALQEVERDCPEIYLSDVIMPEMNGLDAARIVRRNCPHVRVMLFSGQAATKELLRVAAGQGDDFELLPKPLHPQVLIAKLRGDHRLQ